MKNQRKRKSLNTEHRATAKKLAKIVESEYVYKRILLDNHRHEAIDDVFERLTGM